MAKQDAVIKVSLIDGVSAGLSKIQKSIAGVGASLTSVKGLAVQAAAAFGLFKVGAAFTDGVQSAATFEQSLDKISAKTGVTGEALQALGADIRKISQDASKTGADGAAAFQRLGEEGSSAADAIKQLPTALDFATASSQGAAEAVGSLSDNLDAFGLGADQFARAADVITAGALKGGTGVADLQKALQAVGPTARDLGLTLEQTTAALATLAQNGLEGGKAGKALAAVFDQLRDPSSKFREELAKIGITSKDFNIVLAQLGKGGKNTQAALNALGTQGTAAIKALSKDGGVALAALTKQLGDVEGQTSKTAATINQGLLASFTRLKEAGDAAVSAFLQPILGPLSDEFDALAKKINEFVASPDFESLRTDFKAAFVEGLQAVKAFVAEFDFTAATKSVQDFVRDSGKSLSELKDSVGAIAEAVRVTSDAFSLAWNTIQTVTATAVLGVTGTMSKFYGVLGLVSDRAKEISDNFRGVALVAKDEVATQFDQAKNAANRLAGGMGNAADATAALSTAADKNAAAVASMGPPYNPLIQKISQFVLLLKEKAKALGFIKPAIEESDAALEKSGFVVAELTQENLALAQSLDAARDKFALFGDAAQLAAENASITADIAAKSKASFEETQKGIADDIAARKKQAGALREVADASDEAAQSMEDFQAATAEDAGLSDAVFQGLREGFGRVVTDLALLRGVSQDVIRTELNGAIKGSTDSMRGLNEAIQAGDAEIEKLGGSQALQKLRRDAEAAAEAVAAIGPNARAAAADLDAMVRALQDSEAARNGDQASIEQRRFEEELARIAELERASGGTNRAAADLARQLAQKEHQARLAEIAAEGKARVDSELGADAAIAASRAGQSATGAPAGGSGGIGPAPVTTTDNRNIDLSITVQGVIDDALLAKLSRLQKQRARDTL